MTITVQRVYRSDGSVLRRHEPRPADHLGARGRPQPLAPEERGALLAVELRQDGRGRARAEGRLLPDRQPAGSRRTGPSSPRLHARRRTTSAARTSPPRSSVVRGRFRRLARRLRPHARVPVGRRHRRAAGDVHWLRAEIDPDDFVRESNEVNAGTFATASSTIPGYRGQARQRRRRERVRRRRRSTSRPTRSGAASARARSGSSSRRATARLNRASRPDVLRRATRHLHAGPGLGRARTRFTYEARDSASTFPRYPAAAAVTLNVGGVSHRASRSPAPRRA